MNRAKTIMIDLDGVICTEERTFERPLAEPIAGAQEALRKLRAAGHTVIIYTARNWPEYRVTKKWLDDHGIEYRVTKKWLDDHGIEYDGLQMGKPVADVWIDDRALPFTSWNDVLGRLGA